MPRRNEERRRWPISRQAASGSGAATTCVDADEHKTGKLESDYVGIATVQPAEHHAGSGPDRE
ncbi:hypothetical protein GCM10010502_14410 [Kitasatospora aureofaciens]|uniref:Uncharacterized protein n=1 Tax=Kitasatospora aureofaciens TaxID=1894 RepID=A0A8H9HHY0_KITAU|nr:hypothetical protein GCM10010502_14410 [Kitasatospora aureofaciens]